MLEQHLGSEVLHSISVAGRTCTCLSLSMFRYAEDQLSGIRENSLVAYQIITPNVTATCRTMMTLHWAVNQPLLAAVAWILVTRMLYDDHSTTSGPR